MRSARPRENLRVQPVVLPLVDRAFLQRALQVSEFLSFGDGRRALHSDVGIAATSRERSNDERGEGKVKNLLHHVVSVRRHFTLSISRSFWRW